MQYQNKNKTYGKAYKNERIQIQKEIITRFDEIILEATQFEKSGKKEKALPLLIHAQKLSDLLMQFGYWQKIIDERNLFLLYISFSNELGIAEEDVTLAKKNMAFLCKDEKIKSIISSNECL